MFILSIFLYLLKVLNLSIAFVITFLVTNVPYVIHELCIAYLGGNSLSKKTSAIMGMACLLQAGVLNLSYVIQELCRRWTL